VPAPLTRRGSLKIGLGAAASLAAPTVLRAEAPYKRSLRMQSLNSGEKLTVTYWAEGTYLTDALKEINWFMRDLRDQQATSMSVRLLDLLYEIDQRTASTNPLYTLSGYRTERTNTKLAQKSADIDEQSFHLRGMALDLTQDFRNPRALFDVAATLGQGGAGFYPTKRPFVHIDVGPLDTWVWPQKGRPGRAAEYDRHQAQTPSS